eukprot:scaffold202025_cov30-Tisochrysis_lutea.AAC.2
MVPSEATVAVKDNAMPERAEMASIMGATTATCAATSSFLGREKIDTTALSERIGAPGSERGRHQRSGVAGAGAPHAPSCEGDHAGAIGTPTAYFLCQMRRRKAAETTCEATVPHAAPAAPSLRGPTRMKSSNRLAAAANGTASIGERESLLAMKPACNTIATSAAG